jgi:hypothetical protein
MTMMMMTYMSLINTSEKVIRNCSKFIFKIDKQIEEKVLDQSAKSKAFARVGSNLHILNFGRVVSYTLPSFHPREQNILYAIR